MPLTDKWERDESPVGHRPTFKVWCQFCGEDMEVRFSAVFPEPNLVWGFREAGNQIAYKCPSCGYHVRFNITDDQEYIKKIYAARNGRRDYVPLDRWEANESIAKQLEGLGYWGGR